MPINFSIRNLEAGILLKRLMIGPKNDPKIPVKSVLAKNLSLIEIPRSLERIACALVINFGKSSLNSCSLPGV